MWEWAAHTSLESTWIYCVLFPLLSPACVSPAPEGSPLQSFNLGLWVPHPHTNPFCQVLPPLLASLVAGCLVVVPTKDYQVEPCPHKCSNCFLSHMFGKPAVTLIFLLPDPLLSSWQGDWDWPRVSHCGIWPSLRSKRGSLQQSDAQRL